jgi:hypothetical protein
MYKHRKVFNGNALSIADFYGFHSGSIKPGGDIPFPSNGPSLGRDITRLNSTTFRLRSIGTYQVQFTVNIEDSKQLVLTLNNEELPESVTGATGLLLFTTTIEDTSLTVRNPQSSFTPIHFSTHPGYSPVASHLLLTRID